MSEKSNKVKKFTKAYKKYNANKNSISTYSTQALIDELLYRQESGEDIGYIIREDPDKLKPATEDDLKHRHTMAWFIYSRDHHMICSDDGIGYWGTIDQISGIDCFGIQPEGMNYVYWFND